MFYAVQHRPSNKAKVMDELIVEVGKILQQSQRILFITGAGISADSGLPTYRGVSGLYEQKTTEEGYEIEDALSGAMFDKHPSITWKYLHQIESACRGVTYNRGHEVIALFEQEKPDSWVLTQNIDGFHHAAGSRNLIEIHGRIHELYCLQCDYIDEVEDFSDLDPQLPRCPQCNSVIRPNVVFFGEALPEDEVEALYTEVSQGFDLVFSIGTSSVFPYIVAPVMLAREQGKPTVEINPATTQISGVVDYKFTAKAAETLDKLWQYTHSH